MEQKLKTFKPHIFNRTEFLEKLIEDYINEEITYEKFVLKFDRYNDLLNM